MRKRDLKDRATIEAAVQRVADEYLKDPNITSVGVGYKVVDGRPTDELALQFTVSTKFEPQSLEGATTRPIPETLTVNGIRFPTDVVERRYTPNPVAVGAQEKTDRKRRLDPIVPGVSIGAERVSAGTLACLVRETATGETRMLSNWHVLHGVGGELGQRIVQPGAFDDNRVADNGCGRLVRSFLGLAGDCAIASIEGRGAEEPILELGVPVRRLGDPELGDRVVKSGRTTAVTYGVVTRLHTITRLTYGEGVEERIGGFEIGPDPEQPAVGGEISMGGDSGSAWMALDDAGKPTDMMLGLHFAGEPDSDPGEHALACYASSVFGKLEISPLEAPKGDPDVRGFFTVHASGSGYDAAFLPGHAVPVPVATADVEKDYAPVQEGGEGPVRHLTHFSLAMSASRRFCRWVAWNVDGNALQQLSRTGIDFKRDPAFRAEHQVDDDLYSHNRLDRGHIARRRDLLWGTREEATRANADSFFFTNIAPQLDDFNQSAKHGIWGQLEDAVYEDVSVDDLRLAVLGGPIFKRNDLEYRGVLVPRSYWKLIAYAEDGALKAKAYVLTQDDLEGKLESLGLEPFNLYQVVVRELSGLTGLDFGPLTAADTMAPPPGGTAQAVTARPIGGRSEIVR
ncbi:DNA/RNA non-specific endonuclease [Solirubrobacter sp. CPCC 204708]|uniref:DNA/RNA non-specific endonuclease n=1 Tax=Solirubrobacter deserti TaxID=2282478 RepID=A0ABT4RJZ6_9ACTN|nr:DNA/RNA non-specific endonuclease [Solirubrobacter deserti]MBE2315822.1 DNA/RNA non-specific endonuclease [Solirubrobacter deserti]MDA0138842.1 DNA/RNA non-specific endonuclease [Solirubrobacter deserti]